MKRRPAAAGSPAWRVPGSAVRWLKGGGILAFPTDTVPGLGCRAGDGRAVRTIFRLKGRAGTKPLVVFLPSVAAAARFSGPWSPRVRRLLTACWPGPLTAIVRRRRRLPHGVGRGRTVGIRVPAHPLALALTRRVGPLATTSANVSGRPPLSNAAAATRLWPDRVLAVPGPRRSRPSTVVDLTRWPPRILRAGALSPAVLAARVARAEQAFPPGRRRG